MRFDRLFILFLATLLAACSGSGSGSTASGTTPTTSTSGTCSLRARQDWAAATLNEWYLFPETLPANLNPAPYATVDGYIDALTAAARSQRRDRFFTYLTSIAEENAFFSSGSSAGFGVRLQADAAGQRVFIAEAFEGAPALTAGIDRGDEIVAIGTSAGTLRSVSSIVAAEGLSGVSNALGPDSAGTTRTLRIANTTGTRDIAVTKADFALAPVSTRYGSKIIDDGGRRIGYLNLRTFISTADTPMRTAFSNFRAQGITQFVIDLRYNGGGLIDTAELLGDLLGGNRASTDIFDQISYRPEKASSNSIKRFTVQSESVSPVKIAFIGTGATASASELLINAFVPFLGADAALIGTNTFGKPVGQIAIDRPACDDRLRVVALAVQNGAGSANYYDGLATAVTISCRAGDDLTFPLGDPREASLRQALDYIAGVPCSTIAAVPGSTAGRASGLIAAAPAMISPRDPSVPQQKVPGMF